MSGERGRWLVVPGEMFINGAKQGGEPGERRIVSSLICLELDAETARAAGWPEATA